MASRSALSASPFNSSPWEMVTSINKDTNSVAVSNLCFSRPQMGLQPVSEKETEKEQICSGRGTDDVCWKDGSCQNKQQEPSSGWGCVWGVVSNAPAQRAPQDHRLML